ncbi:MAG: trigger factor [Candidatus Magasanikbacteria bacterium]|jgi:trigger factor|nr:trigger factor [Candidatus Magasanikbacteria bacterium]MBT4220973.1 trigger factor [Candidatus Magasanikbacteria bacterium]MBT4350491.1 trigger factor [Candidatus Magasanikbacteria bacterium]MBT4541956.1 trigger factor [Candidatus Magasanikbacteria bacterium]MBT6252878.1 trigger factor [Candidatus Magasanikbacteria bacterium]
MKHTLKKQEKSQVELTIVITKEEYEPYLQEAAKRIADKVDIKGFRKGKAPYEKVEKEVGEMRIYQEALETLIQKTYPEALKKENLDVIGMPQVDVETLVPGNDIVYKAIVALLPKVKIADLTKIKVEKKPKPVEDEKVIETIDALRGMRASEVVTDKAATKEDKLIIDMLMSIDNVPVEGGQAKDYQVYLGEKHYIPGFNDQLLGAKKGEEKIFSLDFPKDHYQKMLAGKSVGFSVQIKEVFERTLPELNDAFAKEIGQDNVDALKKIIRSNMEHEALHKAEEKAEIEILETLVEKSSFDDIPKVLSDHEKQKMFYELTRDLEKNGVTLEQYLQDIKKTEKDLLEDFTTQAEKRAKAALLSRHIAKEQEITATKDAIDKEISMLEETYKDNAGYLENLKRKEVRETIATQLQNKAVMKYLKEQILGSADHTCDAPPKK